MPSIDAQIAEVRRELALRANVYPGLVFSRKMKQEEADIHTANMRAVLETLERTRDNAGMRALASGLVKYAPDLAKQLAERWIKDNKEADAALKRLVDFMREAEA